MSKKVRDPGSFCVPIGIGKVMYEALCDLGASLSIIPLALCEKAGLGTQQPVKMTLYMVDRSIKLPVGILEDIPVLLGKFYIPLDFVVLDVLADHLVPIILGRHFFATSGCVVDCKNGILSFYLGEERVKFHLASMIKGPTIGEDIYNTYDDEEESREEVSSILLKDPLEKVITLCIVDEAEEEECNIEIQALRTLEDDPATKFEVLEEATEKAKKIGWLQENRPILLDKNI